MLLLCPLDCIGVDYEIDLLQELKKRDTDQLVMKSAALETIITLYPGGDWLHIYTDGPSHTRKEREQQFSVIILAFICHLDNMPLILMERERQ
jgi:hypothetical protein